MKKSLTAIAFLSILISCKKEDQQQYPFMLISSRYQVTSYPKVYTRLGEITNRAVADAYLRLPSRNQNHFYFTADTTISIVFSDTITYLSRDTVLFPHLPREWGTRIPKQQGELIYFYMTDTLPGFKIAENPLSAIEKEISIFKPYKLDICFNTGICPYQEVYDAFIATGSLQQLEFPLLTYKLTRNTNRSHAEATRWNYNNLFNLSVLNLLQDGDTLAIQTSKTVYSK
jgi:hypothetical protein